MTRRGKREFAASHEQLLNNFSRSNPDLQSAGNARRENIGGRTGLDDPAEQRVGSLLGEREYITLSTAQLRDGSLLYIIGVGRSRSAIIRIRLPAVF